MESSETQKRLHRLETFEEGRDELNLAEFPLAAICNRYLDGTKTVVFEDTVWDDEKRKRLPRKLTISGSDRFGLPTAKDDDVLLACVQLSSLGNFTQREVHFSRYELLKLLRWPDETRYYRRLATSLRRWKGLTVYSDRAFYDKARRSWVNRDFGIFDNLYIYERDEVDKREASADSWLVWNEVVFGSFSAGYLKKLDWDLYLRLKDPVAKRLYRFLDKRFYHSDRLVLDLNELAFNKVRVSPNYNTAQAKRALMKGIRELEHLWDLRPAPEEKRFSKISRGKWEVEFQKRKRKKPTKNQIERSPNELSFKLTKRGIGPAMANELTEKFPAERIQTMIELFDWHNEKGEERGAGFLVAGIRSAEPYVMPKGFQTEAVRERKRREMAVANRKREEQRRRKQHSEHQKIKEENAPFEEFWKGLSSIKQQEFLAEALISTDRTKKEGFSRLKTLGGPAYEHYRQMILKEHFQRTIRLPDKSISITGR
ncbi:replication initiator protein A [Aeoliella sp.]|uniref:replication initiator protein A n=1 Tax=Aeoliella sp. TaxID=2795800 RepID=UPI003CCBECC6